MLQGGWAHTIMEGNFGPEFELGLAAKDIGLALDMAREYGVPTPLLSIVDQLYTENKAAGKTKESFFSHILRLEELTGVKVRFNK